MTNDNKPQGEMNVQIPDFVRQTLTELDFDKLQSLKQEGFWIDKFKTIINLVPFCGGALAQEVKNYQNYKAVEFFRKFTAYIYELKPTTPEERLKFCEEIEVNAKDYAGNVIMGLVDRLDSIHKQAILANLTNAELMHFISIKDLFRLSSMLERVPYVDLLDLLKYQKPFYDESGNTELLFAAGALRFASLDSENDSNQYVLSSMGQKLVIHGMRTPVNIEFDGLEINIPSYTEEEMNELTSVFSISENERKAIIEEAKLP